MKILTGFLIALFLTPLSGQVQAGKANPFSGTIIPSTSAAGLESTSGTVYVSNRTLTADTTVNAGTKLIVPRGSLINLGGHNLTINCPFEAGPYRVFTGTGTVTFGTGSALKETRAEWWYVGTGTWNSAILAAIAAYPKCPVALPDTLTIDDLVLPPKAILRGGGSRGTSADAGYRTILTHAPTTPGGYAISTDTTGALADGGIELSDLVIHAQSSGNSGAGLRLAYTMGSKVHNVAVQGPFSIAGVICDQLQDVDVDGLKIGNSDTSNKMPIGLWVTRSLGSVSTSTTFKNLYIAGRYTYGATSGVDCGVQIDTGCSLGLAFDRPVIESINVTAVDVHRYNQVDFRDAYTENCPNTTAAVGTNGTWKIGVTTDAGGITTPTTHVNIVGGRNGGYNVGGDSVWLWVDKIDHLLVDGVHTAGMDVGAYYTSTTINGTCAIRNCSDGNDISTWTLGTTIGTNFWPANWDVDSSNKFLVFPAYDKSRGWWPDRPTLRLISGRSYFDIDRDILAVYNKAKAQWVNAADGTAVGNNAVRNGSFSMANSSPAAWTLGSGQAISGGKCNFTAASSNLDQTGIITTSTAYTVTFTVSGLTGGTIRPYLGSTAGTERSADGTYTESITSNGTYLRFVVSGLTAVLDDVTAVP